MTGTGPQDDDLPGGWEAAAGEYALGLLPASEAAAFERRMAQDPDLAQDVAAWQTYFATLAADVAPVAPPPQVLNRVEAQVFAQDRTPLWRQIVPYLAGAAAAALIAWVVTTAGWLGTAPPALTAQLQGTDSGLQISARFEGGQLALRRAAGTAPPDRVLELWLIAQPGSAPVSLGVLSDVDTVVTLPQALARSLPGAVLAVSDEPPGGSPTGAPTGQVRATGQLVPAAG